MKKVYYVEFRIGEDYTVKVLYANPKFRNIKVSRFLKEYPALSEKDIIKEGIMEM